MFRAVLFYLKGLRDIDKNIVQNLSLHQIDNMENHTSHQTIPLQAYQGNYLCRMIVDSQHYNKACMLRHCPRIIIEKRSVSNSLYSYMKYFSYSFIRAKIKWGQNKASCYYPIMYLLKYDTRFGVWRFNWRCYIVGVIFPTYFWPL